MDGQNVNVVWELIPYDTGIQVTKSFDVVRVYPESFGFSCNCGMEFVVSKGFEGFGYPWVEYFT